jgi:hypothetical protein
VCKRADSSVNRAAVHYSEGLSEAALRFSAQWGTVYSILRVSVRLHSDLVPSGVPWWYQALSPISHCSLYRINFNIAGENVKL